MAIPSILADFLMSLMANVISVLNCSCVSGVGKLLLRANFSFSHVPTLIS